MLCEEQTKMHAYLKTVNQDVCTIFMPMMPNATHTVYMILKDVSYAHQNTNQHLFNNNNNIKHILKANHLKSSHSKGNIFVETMIKNVVKDFDE